MPLSNVKALKITAKDLGLKGYSKLSKSEFIELLKPYEEQIRRLPPIIIITANYYYYRHLSKREGSAKVK